MTIKNVFVFDPSSGSTNLGDSVIIESCIDQIQKIYPNIHITKLSLHQPLTKNLRKTMASAELAIVAGSNMLNTRLASPWGLSRWRISLADAFGNILLMGVGWNKANDWVNPLGAFILRRVLSKGAFHSVRDSLTQKNLEKAGIKNVLLTSCPTLWELPAICSQIPEGKGRDVVVTLTFNSKERQLDSLLLALLRKKYRKIYFWPQGHDDGRYLEEIKAEGMLMLPGSLSDYDKLLENEDSLDYVGLRLHGGIRAMQKKRRAIIISVDHRASGVSESSGLPIVNRQDLEGIEKRIDDSWKTKIFLPEAEIENWRDGVRRQLQ